MVQYTDKDGSQHVELVEMELLRRCKMESARSMTKKKKKNPIAQCPNGLRHKSGAILKVLGLK